MAERSPWSAKGVLLYIAYQNLHAAALFAGRRQTSRQGSQRQAGCLPMRRIIKSSVQAVNRKCAHPAGRKAGVVQKKLIMARCWLECGLQGNVQDFEGDGSAAIVANGRQGASCGASYRASYRTSCSASRRGCICCVVCQASADVHPPGHASADVPPCCCGKKRIFPDTPPCGSSAAEREGAEGRSL